MSKDLHINISVPVKHMSEPIYILCVSVIHNSAVVVRIIFFGRNLKTIYVCMYQRKSLFGFEETQCFIVL